MIWTFDTEKPESSPPYIVNLSGEINLPTLLFGARYKQAIRATTQNHGKSDEYKGRLVACLIIGYILLEFFVFVILPYPALRINSKVSLVHL
jgi:hypothetical protein